MEAKDRLILALDVDTLEEAQRLVEATSGYVGVYKVGMQLYNSVGPSIVKWLHDRGEKVFVDLKFHDIPNTVAQAGQVMTRLGAYIFNVHAAGGKKMMAETAVKSKTLAEELGLERPKVIAVTLLTSLDGPTVRDEVGLSGEVVENVVRYAVLAKEAGLDGVVASPQEVKAIREACGEEFCLVIPGIRPAWAATDDQKRIMTPKEAIVQGATYIVVGRPIAKAANPSEAAALVVKEIEDGLREKGAF